MPAIYERFYPCWKKQESSKATEGQEHMYWKKTPDELTLLSIYKSVMDNGEIHLLDIHQNPNDQCIVGKHIKPVLESMFNKIEEAFVRQLSIMTLRDCINEIKKQIQ